MSNEALLIGYPCSRKGSFLEMGTHIEMFHINSSHKGEDDVIHDEILIQELDETGMLRDLDAVRDLLTFYPGRCKYKMGTANSTELGCIMYISNFLTFRDCHHNLHMLYVVGHGLNKESAKAFGENLWSTDIKIGSGGQVIPRHKRDANWGDVVFYWSMFFSPEWVVDQLRQCYRESTVVIIIDACFSGVWTETLSRCLQETPLEHTRVIVQTASGANEPSYGNVFTPSFCALQRADDKYLQEVSDVPYNPSEAMERQTPTFYDSLSPSQNSDTPYYTEVNIDGIRLRFFTDAEFFDKFSDISFSDNACSIPDEDLKKFFESFGDERINQIRCYKLKHDSPRPPRPPKPIAFILVQWHPAGEQRSHQYHLHLHFDRVGRNMVLESVSCLRTELNRPDSKYVRREVDRTINGRDDQKTWNYVDHSHLIPECIKFIGEETWQNPESWHMKACMPNNIIRSRSSVLEEIIDGNNFKTS